MEANKKFSPIVPELFLRGKKINISLVFISQSYFKVPKTIMLNATHYFIIKIIILKIILKTHIHNAQNHQKLKNCYL